MKKPTLKLPADPHYNGYPVRIMTVAEGYAMVRRKGCMPFVVQVKELREGPDALSAPESRATDDPISTHR